MTFTNEPPKSPPLQRTNTLDSMSKDKDNFPLADMKQKVPPWVPYSLVVFSTAAIVAPIFFLRRHRASVRTLQTAAAPPPRRGDRAAIQSFATSTPTSASTPWTAAAASSSSVSLEPLPDASGPYENTSIIRELIFGSEEEEAASQRLATKSGELDNFDGPLYTLKAFTIATAGVVFTASVSIWGLMQYVGARDTQEFAQLMRSAVLTRLPRLSARIHRPSETGDNPSDIVPILPSSSSEPWTWTDAEERLKKAFDEGGLPAWGEAAIAEVEAEGHAERLKRGFVDTSPSRSNA